MSTKSQQNHPGKLYTLVAKTFSKISYNHVETNTSRLFLVNHPRKLIIIFLFKISQLLWRAQVRKNALKASQNHPDNWS